MMNREDAAIAAAIAPVEAANAAAAALVDTVAASGAVCRSDAKAMDAVIYDFAASILYFIISQNHLRRTSGLSSSCFFLPPKPHTYIWKKSVLYLLCLLNAEHGQT